MASSRQREAAKNTYEMLGKPKGEILREAGYKESVALNPKIVTESKGYKESLEEYFPDDKLNEVALQALEAQKWNDFTGEKEPDHNIRHKFWRDIHQQKGHFPKDGNNVLVNGDLTFVMQLDDSQAQ